MKTGKKFKVHRMTKHFRPRSNSWKTRHILTLSLIGFVWYTIISRLHAPGRRSSLLNTLQTIRPEGELKIGSSFYDEENPNVEEARDEDRGSKVRSLLMQPQPIEFLEPVVQVSSTPRQNPRLLDNLSKESLEGEKVKEPHSNQNTVEVKTNFIPKGGAPDTFSVRPSPNSRLQFGSYKTPAPGLKEIPIILVWKAMEYQMKDYKQHLEFYLPGECGGCHITTNRSTAAECEALVHFNHPDLRKFMDVPDPRTRNPNQIYAFWSRETPSKTYPFHTVLKDSRFDGIFNVTINFRRDADIVDYFGNTEWELRFFKEKNKNKIFYNKLMGRKVGLAVWAVSNCNSTYGASERMQFAKRLMNAGLNLTAYGSCFNKRYTNAQMMVELMNHKFYMSLENSIHCPDYVSEKFWRNGLRAGAVPVVWGPTREDVAMIAPSHSYIHAEDFETPEKLVAYLNYLDKNDTAYREYHAWRFTPADESIPEVDIIPTHRSTLCRLCKRVVAKPRVHTTIPSVHDWLYKKRFVDDLCFKL